MIEAIELIKEIQGKLSQSYPFLSDWGIAFDYSKRRAGICKMSNREISFSKHHIENNSLAVVEDTILHEFAHAIAYVLHKDTGHGHHWKRIAKEIGATPKAKGTFELPVAPWLLVHHCPTTLEIKPITARFRRNKKIKNYFLIGKPDTKGQLFFLKQSDYQQFENGIISKDKLDLIQ